MCPRSRNPRSTAPSNGTRRCCTKGKYPFTAQPATPATYLQRVLHDSTKIYRRHPQQSERRHSDKVAEGVKNTSSSRRGSADHPTSPTVATPAALSPNCSMGPPKPRSYEPTKPASRFSMKAATPSRASSVRKHVKKASISAVSPSPADKRNASFRARLAAP